MREQGNTFMNEKVDHFLRVRKTLCTQMKQLPSKVSVCFSQFHYARAMNEGKTSVRTNKCFGFLLLDLEMHESSFSFFEYLVRQLFIPLSYFEKTYSCWLFLKLMTDYVKNHPCKYICTIIMHTQYFPFLLDYRSEFVKQITIIRKRRNSCRHLKSVGFLQVNLYSIVAF